MAKEETVKPFVTIDDVQISAEDLPEEAQGIFGRLQRLNQKKATLALDMEEIDASINFFSSRIISIVNSSLGQGEEEEEEEAVKSNN
tara:strand:+ start:389 stop:649 length:261 start_codon:yes stop_codon:yes gene_type:complete